MERFDSPISRAGWKSRIRQRIPKPQGPRDGRAAAFWKVVENDPVPADDVVQAFPNFLHTRHRCLPSHGACGEKLRGVERSCRGPSYARRGHATTRTDSAWPKHTRPPARHATDPTDFSPPRGCLSAPMSSPGSPYAIEKRSDLIDAPQDTRGPPRHVSIRPFGRPLSRIG